MARLLRVLTALAGLAAFAFIAGFVIFASQIERSQPRDVAAADGIVVLTGGEHRVVEGLRLLAMGKGKRLLISGANERTSSQTLRRLTGTNRALFQCCVDIGRDAKDTHGNALEAREWNQKWGQKSLIVVTSTYHMPRSLCEMATLLPGTKLIPYPVISQNVQLKNWWLHLPTAQVIFIEYVKYLPSAARNWFIRTFNTQRPNRTARGAPPNINHIRPA